MLRFFKTLSQSDAVALVGDGSEIVNIDDGWCVSVIGLIATGEITVVDGEEVPVYMDGYHFNAWGNVPPEWDQYEVFPKNPIRVMA